MCQQTIGFHHIARVFAQRGAIQCHHAVDRGLQLRHAFGQALAFGHLIRREEFRGRHDRIVQHSAPITEAFAKHASCQGCRVALSLLITAIVQRIGINPIDNLGQHHGDCLEVVDFLIIIGPLGPVLNRKDTNDTSAAQDRDTEKGVERVFAGLRPVGE